MGWRSAEQCWLSCCLHCWWSCWWSSWSSPGQCSRLSGRRSRWSVGHRRCRRNWTWSSCRRHCWSCCRQRCCQWHQQPGQWRKGQAREGEAWQGQEKELEHRGGAPAGQPSCISWRRPWRSCPWQRSWIGNWGSSWRALQPVTCRPNCWRCRRHRGRRSCRCKCRQRCCQRDQQPHQRRWKGRKGWKGREKRGGFWSLWREGRQRQGQGRKEWRELFWREARQGQRREGKAQEPVSIVHQKYRLSLEQ